MRRRRWMRTTMKMKMKRMKQPLTLLVAVSIAVWLSTATTASGNSEVQSWSDSFGSALRNYSDRSLGVSHLQQQWDSLTYDEAKVNSTDDFKSLLASLEKRLSSKKTALTAIRDKIEEVLQPSNTPASSSYTQCCDTSPPNYNNAFKTNVDTTKTCVRLPDGVSASVAANKRVIDASHELESVFRAQYQRDASLKWMYFGSTTGVFRFFPAAKSSSCTSYDPRFRPWYVQSSSSKGKDVVIIIDQSGSMSLSGRMAAARNAAVTVLQTLNPSDKVSVVAFSTDANLPTSIDSCFETSLVDATPTNLALLIDWVNKLSAGGWTYYNKALDAAFTVLKNTQASNTDTTRPGVILFLTDGQPTEGDRSTIIAKLNSANSPRFHLLTYGMGNGLQASDLNFLRKMAKREGQTDWNGELTNAKQDFGLFEAIPDGGNLRTAMGSYYQFDKFATDAAADLANRTVRTSVPYFDSSGLGMMVTLVANVYDKTTTPPTLLGVAGVDVTLDELLTEVEYFHTTSNSYAFITDDQARAVVHPDLPQLQSVTEDPLFIPIKNLESSNRFSQDVYPGLRDRAAGNVTFSVQQTRSRGDDSGGSVEFTARMTYIWAPVQNSSFSLTFAVDANDTVIEVPKVSSATDGIVEQHYHRIDLITASDTVAASMCSYLGQIANRNVSTFKLGPSAYADPFQYLTVPETKAQAQLLEDSANGKQEYGGFANRQIMRDVWVTSYMQEKWLQTSLADRESIVWRYVGTINGVFRTFPGHPSQVYYDPKQRPWYYRALANRGEYAMAAPYWDASGAGTVVTLSTVVYEGRSSGKHSTNDPVHAVAGIDFTLGVLHNIVRTNVPKCKQVDYKCMVVDRAGYLVYHPDFVSPSTSSTSIAGIWIGQKEPTVGRMLTRKSVTPTNAPTQPFLSKSDCIKFDSGEQETFWRANDIVDGSAQPATATIAWSNSESLCNSQKQLSAQLYVSRVPRTNLHMIIVHASSGSSASFSQCSNDCSCPSNKLCDSSTHQDGDCRCPCTTKLTYKPCEGEYKVTASNVSACAIAQSAATGTTQSFSGDGYSRCYPHNCGAKSTLSDCVAVVGCQWCGESEISGTCQESTTGCSTQSKEDDGASSGAAVAAIVIVSVFASLGVVGYCAILYVRKQRSVQQRSEMATSSRGIHSVSSAESIAMQKRRDTTTANAAMGAATRIVQNTRPAYNPYTQNNSNNYNNNNNNSNAVPRYGEHVSTAPSAPPPSFGDEVQRNDSLPPGYDD
eukprot:TRINITY_DN67553_c14_g3_i1.p1 TRINITY_DN67553_c14_g3~~TRINITY_DN67553_c14_g3_i1.p1  ORF type:complete len:1249 (-),score=652.98 TRINITY_DN67553_c14_g3_i1:2425-6171(-)